MRKIKRKLNLNSRVIAVLAIFLSVGFAYISSAINIDGLFTIFQSTYDVHFENLHVINGSVEAETPTYNTDDTEVSVSVRFNNPGDFYEFTIDAVNAGDIDAMLNTVTNIELTEDQEKYIDYTVTYEDGEELAQYQELNSGDTCTFKVKASFKEDIEKEDLPVNGDSIDITLDTEYIRADDNRIKRRAENSLYNVLKKEANSGDLAKKYTGEHQDSMDESLSTKDIYYWNADNNTEATTILNKNNVIFANQCWQMIRTTDTGGTKLLYNGEAENNQCLDERSQHIGYNNLTTQNLRTNIYYGTDYNYNKETNLFTLSGEVTTGEIQYNQYTCLSENANGTCATLYYVYKNKSGNSYYTLKINSNMDPFSLGSLPYNNTSISLSAAGYMNKTTYSAQRKYYIAKSYTVLTKRPYSGDNDRWAAETYEYINNQYKLINPFKIGDLNDYSTLEGKYTILNTNKDASSLDIYYIVKTDETSYYIKDINKRDIFTYGNTYTNNGDGTYTINNPQTLSDNDYFENYSSINNKYVCKNATNNTCNELWYTVNTDNTHLNYFIVDYNYKFSKGFTYKIDETDGTYKYYLNEDDSKSFWNVYDENNRNQLNNAHYTCWDNVGKCKTVSYIFDYTIESKWRTVYEYIDINDGKEIDDAINEMLYDDNINTYDSIIKMGIDEWYKKYMLSYSDYTEDTIYCNDRTVINFQEAGFNPNGGDISQRTTKFNNYETIKDLSCNNETDKFSTNNNKAKLKYKVGLLTYPEINLTNNKKIHEDILGYSFWTMTPKQCIENILTLYLGNNSTMPTNYGYMIKPTISLKPGSFYTTGNGSKETPYIVYTE